MAALDLFPPEWIENISASWIQPPQNAVVEDYPAIIPNAIVKLLKNEFEIPNLYLHQVQCINSIIKGNNVIISTGTASGKSFCYQIPILKSLLEDQTSTALLLYPTKALAIDQLKSFRKFITKISPLQFEKNVVCSYDGDTPSRERSAIRNSTGVLISNPDMLHIGILPHHPSWERFFSKLEYVVIDEAHSYSGVFGAHFANLIRRLKRICAFYGSQPQFIISSATVTDPQDFGADLIEEDVVSINEDFSPKHEKRFIFYNPPIINEELGLRKSMSEESERIAGLLLSKNLQTILFSRSRISVEMMYRRLAASTATGKYKIAPYRSGYRKMERRKIESGLKERELDLVVSTTALELGIDMGMVDAILMNGYPGSITRFLQQSGRAGRRNRTSHCVLVASSIPLDQYIIRHPEFIKGKHPEKIYINANNPFILFHHLRCASFELPFKVGDNFSHLCFEEIANFLDVLQQVKTLYLDNQEYFWISDKYPASDVSLRSISDSTVKLINGKGKNVQIGEIDPQSAKRFVHPGAIYIHAGEPFLVNTLDLEEGSAVLLPASDSMFFTEPILDITTTIESVDLEYQEKDLSKGFGDVRVETTYKGFTRKLWETFEELSRETLDLEPDILQTKGVWLQLSVELAAELQQKKLWAIMPIDYGKEWPVIRQKILERDAFTCQACSSTPQIASLHVHHKQPLRLFDSIVSANRPENLITLCPSCHHLAEQNLRIRGTLFGLAYGIANIIPVFIKCSDQDIGYTIEQTLGVGGNSPGIIFFDQFPGGIGLARNAFEQLPEIMEALHEHIQACPCKDGCPSCVGPGGENGFGAKQAVNSILERLQN